MTSQNLTLPLLPLKSGVLLPGMVFTMALESEEALAAADAAGSAGGRLLLVPHIDGRYAGVGVVAEVVEQGELPGGLRALAVRGEQRATIGTGVPGTGDALWVEAELLEEPEASPAEVELAREYRAVLENILLSRGAGRIAAQLREVTEPGRLADVAGYSPDLSLAQKVQVLETLEVEARLRLVLGWARDVLADLALRERIKTDVEEGMEKTQREFLLRRQLESIRKELGELSGADDGDPDDYRTRVEERDLPDHVRSAVLREVDKLERTSDQSPETGWIRTWLDTVLEVPWGVESEDRLDVAEAARILDEDHDGLEDVKERILEHLAVRKLQAERGMAPVDGRGLGAILALVGPPGVGKTSLGESVARALGRRFVRVSLGGVRDEAEIRGHRRTYVGAQPGRLVRALREAETMNPVIVLDEVDKLGADFRGDPSSALLEVLDPAQNHTFRDHYLEVDLDLSPGPVRRHGQRGRHHPRPALGPDGGHPPGRLHRGREGRHRPAPPGATPARAGRPAPRRGGRSQTTPSGRSWPTTPGRPASARSNASSADCCARWRPSWLPASARHRWSSGSTTSGDGWAGPASSSRRPTGPVCPGWSPASP